MEQGTKENSRRDCGETTYTDSIETRGAVAEEREVGPREGISGCDLLSRASFFCSKQTQKSARFRQHPLL